MQLFKLICTNISTTKYNGNMVGIEIKLCSLVSFCVTCLGMSIV